MNFKLIMNLYYKIILLLSRSELTRVISCIIVIIAIRLCFIEHVYAEGWDWKALGEYIHADALSKEVEKGTMTLEEAKIQYDNKLYSEMSNREKRDYQKSITSQLKFETNESRGERFNRLGYDDYDSIVEDWNRRERNLAKTLSSLPKLPNVPEKLPNLGVMRTEAEIQASLISPRRHVLVDSSIEASKATTAREEALKIIETEVLKHRSSDTEAGNTVSKPKPLEETEHAIPPYYDAFF